MCVRAFRRLGTLERSTPLVLKFRAVHHVTGFLFFPVVKEARMWIVWHTDGKSVMRPMDVERPDGRRRARAEAGGVRIRGLFETVNCGFVHFSVVHVWPRRKHLLALLA